ncbi:MAG: carbohydrate ABC transporter permease [Lentisphaeraceae bacterium]|nr:carbohydrate ABC transporter permease [Lentisphaeraceae bacterium]
MKKIFGQLGFNLILIPFVVIFCYPLLWLVASCFKENRYIYKPMMLWPEKWNFQYFSELLSEKDIQFWDLWANSLIMTGSQAFLAVIISAATAYYFVFRESKWNRFLFVIAVALILIPRQIMIFPLRELIFDIKMNDNLLSVILPGAISGIGILFFIQIYKNLPKDYIDMARMEGASEFRVFANTIPLLFSSFLCCFMIHFLIAWQMHLIPLQLLNDNQVLPVGLGALFTSSTRYNMAVIMCAGLFCILPSAIIFLCSYKRFRSALSESIS